MSSLLNVSRLDRKFIYESANSPNEEKLKYNDPSFITFRVLFDFEPIISNDEVTQGLLLDESRDESAISYLRRTGELERSEALKEFRWLLSKISNEFPWFFKSMSGIGDLWAWGYPEGDGIKTEPVTLDVDCYETVDLRMTALADLYRKSTWDRSHFRDLLTLDKKRFNMTIIIGEARKLRTFMNSDRGPGKTEWLKHMSAVAFRCLDCEFDFSEFFATSIDSSAAPTEPAPTFKIKVNRVQETNSYLLLNYMLGEMKRDLIIKQGGSGASTNESREIIDYQSLLSPFIRSYENNYDQVLTDLNSLKNNNLINNIDFVVGDRLWNLPRDVREQIQVSSLNSLDKSGERAAQSNSIVQTINDISGIKQEEIALTFGRPTVEK